MFGIEHLRGESVVARETSMAGSLEMAVQAARSRALMMGADHIRVSDAEGNEIGIFPIPSSDDA
jgi:hypothetical protein